jgi:glycyl-tRNA synthetase
VVETSIGLDRMFLSIVSNAYTEEKLAKEDGSTDERAVMRIPPALAPVKLAVLPLVKKDGLAEKATDIKNKLKFEFNCQYDEKDSIGKRYRRQDAIGTPYCITVDHQTMSDDTVTIRYRDSMLQERVPVSRLSEIISEKVSLKNLLKKIG